jgi:hypothetical protein
LASLGFSCSAREKSKPRNGAGEIFMTAPAEIARETVSGANRLAKHYPYPPQIREKIGFLEKQEDLQFQLANNWLGREDSNLRMAESKSAALPLGDAPIPLSPRLAPAAAGP